MKAGISKCITRALLLVSLISLSACSTIQSSYNDYVKPKIKSWTDASAKPWAEHKAAAEKLQQWNLSGKLAVKTGNEGGQARLRWQRDAQTQHIELAGPIGTGRVVLDEGPSGAVLKDTAGQVQNGPDLQTLLQQRLGWPIPFSKLQYWVRGLPASEAALTTLNKQGQLLYSEEGGWQVKFLTYQSITTADQSTVQVPRVMELTALPGTVSLVDPSMQQPVEDFFARIVISRWQ